MTALQQCDAQHVRRKMWKLVVVILAPVLVGVVSRSAVAAGRLQLKLHCVARVARFAIRCLSASAQDAP